jgi:DNA-binding transcriptional ArsR family regulator
VGLQLPEPKDAATVIHALEGMAPAERLPALAFHLGVSSEIVEALKQISYRGNWNNADLNHLQQIYQQKGMQAGSNRLVIMLDWWSRPDEFGELYLAALQAYVENFYTEEERRIRPYLQGALVEGWRTGFRLDFFSSMVELTQGVKISALEEADEVIFVPSYWTTPLVMYDRAFEKHWVVLYGARPADVSLVPGALVPDAMLLALKALSDPTRLLILRYLSEQPQTPSQLARRLRLRAPTVVHHLSALRLAGLVYISLEEEEEKRYTVRDTAVQDTYDSLHRFLVVNGDG